MRFLKNSQITKIDEEPIFTTTFFKVDESKTPEFHQKVVINITLPLIPIPNPSRQEESASLIHFVFLLYLFGIDFLLGQTT